MILFLLAIFSLHAGRLEELKEKALKILPHHGWGLLEIQKFTTECHPLLVASAVGDLGSVRYYIEDESTDCDIGIESWMAKTALMIAAGHTHAPIAEYLLQHGAQPAKQDKNGWTALHFAIAKDGHATKENNTHVIGLLVKYGVPLNSQTFGHKFTALDWAAGINMRCLLLLGAQVDGSSTLYLRCHYLGDIPLLARSLISTRRESVLHMYGSVSPFFMAEGDPEGNCALAYAAARRDYGAVNMLLEHGAPLNHRNNNGNTAYSHVRHILKRKDLEETEKIEYQKIQSMLHQRACHIADVLKQLGLPKDIRNCIKALC